MCGGGGGGGFLFSAWLNKKQGVELTQVIMAIIL